MQTTPPPSSCCSPRSRSEAPSGARTEARRRPRRGSSEPRSRLVDEVVLRGSTSDDGSADVDEVWDYQRDGSLTYEPGPGFAALGVAPGAEALTLSSAPRPEGKGQARPSQITVDVS